MTVRHSRYPAHLFYRDLTRPRDGTADGRSRNRNRSIRARHCRERHAARPLRDLRTRGAVVPPTGCALCRPCRVSTRSSAAYGYGFGAILFPGVLPFGRCSNKSCTVRHAIGNSRNLVGDCTICSPGGGEMCGRVAGDVVVQPGDRGGGPMRGRRQGDRPRTRSGQFDAP
ncbi:hypothetical protein NONO_c65600 [Nocardia nova SH22a]|uniref:Uncharacterized protein n=1 Tax=Nocardia nova SH22a TaxID=1415166 RepID=W5TPM9_9NOCA|nr:hypothetical protein NONO_c65600 [Nocardia nova SH22a]